MAPLKRVSSLAAGVLILAVSWAAAGPPGGFQERELPEPVLKAGFLFNFAKYVEWPAGALKADGAPIVVGVLGRDPVGDVLESALAGKAVRGHGFQIRRLESSEGIEKCHILFIPRGERARYADLLAKLRGTPVLTVGEDPDFCRAGGALNILVEGGKPRLEANPSAAEKARLTIDAKLLRAATIVGKNC